MLNHQRPGTLLAIMSLVMGVMFWLIFATCYNISSKLNLSNAFNANKVVFVFFGIIIPLVGLSGGLVNVWKENDSDERPYWILLIGVFVLLGSIFIDAKMVIDVFSGGKPIDPIGE